MNEPPYIFDRFSGLYSSLIADIRLSEFAYTSIEPITFVMAKQKNGRNSHIQKKLAFYDLFLLPYTGHGLWTHRRKVCLYLCAVGLCTRTVWSKKKNDIRYFSSKQQSWNCCSRFFAACKPVVLAAVDHVPLRLRSHNCCWVENKAASRCLRDRWQRMISSVQNDRFGNLINRCRVSIPKFKWSSAGLPMAIEG